MEKDENQARYWTDYTLHIGLHFSRASDLQKAANEFVSSAMRALMYLNGGGLLAIPAVVAMFQLDVKQAKSRLVATAAFFFLGLLCVLVAYTYAYFSIGRQIRSEFARVQETQLYLEMLHYPGTQTEQEKRRIDRQEFRDQARKHLNASRAWEIWTIFILAISAVFFTFGAIAGARLILK